MEQVAENWIWGMIVLPVAIGLFRAELGRIWNAYSVYKNRIFNVGDIAEIPSGSSGRWVKVEILSYVFNLSADAGVLLKYSDDAEEPMSLSDWGAMRKRIPKAKDKK